MSVIVSAGDLDIDAVPLLNLLRDELSGSIDQKRLDWLYRGNPQGEARIWVATEVESGKLVGAAALFPRTLLSRNGAKKGFVLGDFCVSADQRSLGLAIRLQRKCLESVQSGAFLGGYDLPSRTMLAVYQRLGIKEVGLFSRMVRLLRVDEKVARRVRVQGVAKVFGRAANAALTLAGGSLRLRSGAKVEVQTGRFGEEFTELAKNVGARLGTCVERSAAFLNWRYADHPQQKFEILTARQDRLLAGYVVVLQEGSRVTVVDLLSVEPPDIRKDLLRAAIALSKSRGCESVQASILASHPYQAEMKSLGFRSRESSPVIFLGGAESGPADANWLLMEGDRES